MIGVRILGACLALVALVLACSVTPELGEEHSWWATVIMIGALGCSLLFPI